MSSTSSDSEMTFDSEDAEMYYIAEDMKIVNTGHALQSSIISLGLLHIFAFESVLQSSFKFFASIHLLVFGSPFIARGWAAG